MAPRKKPSSKNKPSSKKKPSPVPDENCRRSPRISGKAPEILELPKRKRAKSTPTISDAEEEAKPVSPVKEESADEEEDEKVVSPVEEEESASDEEEPEEDAKTRMIVIEHCKSCNSFKTRAAQVKKGLEEGVEGIEVVVNPEKPRKGCFEVREDGDGEVFVSLLNLKRPFKKMKDLNMEELIAEIVQKIKNDD